jgi:hypothetical protein
MRRNVYLRWRRHSEELERLMGKLNRMLRWPLLVCVLLLGCGGVVSVGAELTTGPKDQFQSVTYVRKAGADMEMYKKLHPDTLTHIYPEDFYDWGGKYMYMWFNPFYVNPDEKASTFDASDAKDPRAYVEMFTRGMWNDWEKVRAAGLVTGERPAKFEDHCFVSEAYATAVRDGVTPLPDRLPRTSGAKNTTLCIANPDSVRIMTDIVKFNAAHLYNYRNRPDRYMPVNGGFIDLDGRNGTPLDFSEYTRAKFEAWIRANYTPEQIRTMFEADPAKPITFLASKGAKAEAQRIRRRLHEEFFYNVLLPQYCRTLEEAIDGVLKPGKFHFIYHGDGYEWRIVGGYPTNMVVWGDWMDSYATECARTTCVQRGGRFYATPDFIEPRVSNVYANRDNSNNVYDYQYGAGRLWGEPVAMKTGYRGPHPAFPSAAIAQLGLAEGVALLGNMRLDVSKEGAPGEKTMPGSYVLPFVEFIHTIAPQVRQMIPAARVGVVFSPGDSMTFRGFQTQCNDIQAFQVSNILHRQHVPLQVAHLGILEQTLAQRPMDVLIVPWVKCPKDAQAAALAKYVQDGGKIIFVGEDSGTLTWEGIKREKNAFADLIPAMETGKVTYRQAGKGRTALIPGALDETVDSAQRLHTALFELLGQTPSCVRPDQYPVLLTNLTRNSDNSRFYMHLVNFDVEYNATDAQKPVRPLRDVRVVVPLPEGLQAKAAKLYCPGSPGVDVTPETGREGCAVTVPNIDIYALVAIETAPGPRNDKPLLTPATVAEAPQIVAKGFDATPTTRSLVAPPAIAAAPATPLKPRGFETRLRSLIAYATSADGQAIAVQLTGNPGARGPSAYYSDGRRAVPQVVSDKGMTTVSFPAPQAGGHLAIISPSGLLFTHNGGACFEASRQSPIELRETGDSAPWYIYVPKACRSFRLFVNTRRGAGDGKTPPVYSVHLVVKDAAGAVRLDKQGPLDGGYDNEALKPLEIQVPAGQAGKVWSLWFLDHPSEKGKWPMYFHLEGIPPIVAQAPGQLLIGKGEE